MSAVSLSPVEPPSEAEFARLVAFFRARTGIVLGAEKRELVVARLQSRLWLRKLSSFGPYLGLLLDPTEVEEAEAAVSALTTHETAFFREPGPLERVWDAARQAPPGAPFRVWSAACSTGEEAATVALALAELPGLAWEVVGTDVAEGAVAAARLGHFPLVRAERIPERLLHRHCLKGVDEEQGLFCLKPALAARLRFEQANLLEPQDRLGDFEVVLLRNVLIYFDATTQQRILETVRRRLRPGGLLVLGHAESAVGVPGLARVEPCVYRAPAAGGLSR